MSKWLLVLFYLYVDNHVTFLKNGSLDWDAILFRNNDNYSLRNHGAWWLQNSFDYTITLFIREEQLNE
jgi:hypothetical protein